MQSLQLSLIDFSNKRSSNHFIDYNDYIEYQTKKGLSFEKDNIKWTEGQVKCIKAKFSHLSNKNLRILDICCGDGRGLKTFIDLGFKDITGVEICDEKIIIAKQIHNNILKRDICSGPFELGEKYDIIYSSHSLEHVLNPEFTLKNILTFLKEDGICFLILPYPDLNAGDPQNDHSFKIHCGVVPLGLHIEDNGNTVCSNIEKMGFKVLEKSFFNYRENEIHITIKKISVKYFIYYFFLIF